MVADIDEALRRAQGGDPDAYGIVVKETQARLRSFIAGYVPRAEWVDEIAQQTFVSAYRDLRKFRVGVASLGPAEGLVDVRHHV